MIARQVVAITSIVVFTILMSCSSKKSIETAWSVKSPSGKIAFNLLSTPNGKLEYYVTSTLTGTETKVIENSPLGIIRQDQQFDSALVFEGRDSVKLIDEEYTLKAGKKLINRNKGSELVLHFKNANGKALDIIVRAYDDGVAYRYRFPENEKEENVVTSEKSGFKIPVNGKAWIQPYDSVTKYTPAYERIYLEVNIGDKSPIPNGWCFPALFNTNNHWILLTEAGLDENYFGSHLQPEAPNGLYTVRNPEQTEALSSGDAFAHITLPFATPWRVAIVSDKQNGVVESNLVNHLAPAPQSDNFDWVKPGLSSWSWWSDHDSSQDFKRLKKFVDLSADMGWPYSLVDANWNVMNGGTLEQLADYAKSKNIGLLMWYNSGGAHNEVTEQPKDIMYNADQRKAELKRIAALGVKGIKVDFFQSDKQHIIKEYIDILRDAAAQKIMVNFHGCTIPRGWSRTWPNLVSMESVRGAESYSFAKNYPQEAPTLNTIVPFTRNVIGSMDYTPVTFSNQTYPHITSNAHELALAIVFESGITHLADRVEAYQKLPEVPKQLLKELPAAWDDIKFISGTPGKDVVLARRSGDIWYVAGINGESIAKTFTLNLSFLSSDHKAIMINDGRTSGSFATSEKLIIPATQETVSILPYGGFVMKLIKE